MKSFKLNGDANITYVCVCVCFSIFNYLYNDILIHMYFFVVVWHVLRIIFDRMSLAHDITYIIN